MINFLRQFSPPTQSKRKKSNKSIYHFQILFHSPENSNNSHEKNHKTRNQNSASDHTKTFKINKLDLTQVKTFAQVTSIDFTCTGTAKGTALVRLKSKHSVISWVAVGHHLVFTVKDEGVERIST